jgi:hypothetical protein
MGLGVGVRDDRVRVCAKCELRPSGLLGGWFDRFGRGGVVGRGGGRDRGGKVEGGR